jgi:hypothetical protein
MNNKIAEYFKRSFFAIDGLWFLMVEKESSFERALDIDEKAWEIMPKIQSKKLRELYNINGESLKDLIQALKIKLEIEGYNFKIEDVNTNLINILIHNCPWYTIMKNAKRESFAGKVGERICTIEYQGWADTFNEKIKFSLGSQICKKNKICKLSFTDTN